MVKKSLPNIYVLKNVLKHMGNKLRKCNIPVMVTWIGSEGKNYKNKNGQSL